MAEWMTIRVVLTDGQGIELDPAPGRVILAHAEHTFAELSEAIDSSLGRWDLAPDHEFEVEGRLVASDPTALPVLSLAVRPENSADVTLADVGLQQGSRFAYLFDTAQRWTHRCQVEEVGLDPFALVEDEPEIPVPVYGWGDLPDQFGRIDEDDEAYLPDEALAEVLGEALRGDDDDDLEVVLDLDDGDDEDEDDDDRLSDVTIWPLADPSSWQVVAKALNGLMLDIPVDELRDAVDEVRLHEDNDWPWDVLWAAAGMAEGELPDRDDQLWLELASGVVVPRDVLPLDQDTEEAWAALEPADWAGAVIGLVRAGVGQDASPAALLQLIADCDEVDSGILDDEEEETLLAGFETVVELWRALGAVDESGRLTALGRWGLPRALERAWT